MLISKRILAEAEAQPDYWHGIFKRTFSSESGRICLLKILEASGLFTTSGGTPDHANWVDGRRSLALEILETVQIDPLDVALDGITAEENISNRMGGENE